MENQVMNGQNLIEADVHQPKQQEVRELGELQLALIGGGCAEVCPY